MEIIDVIYGKFTIPMDIAEIVATPQFSRLKLIKQLGFLRLKNGIEQEHHRYAHCLGTYFAASLMLDALEKNTEWLRNNNNKIPLVYRKAVQIAALLHDIAHGPFSHSWEHVVSDYTHETEACASIDHIFMQLNHKLFPELRRNSNYGIELIKALIEGDIDSFKFKNQLPNQFKFLFEIVSNKRSKLDVDKWDYLKRDGYYLKHLSQPNMDFDDVFLQARVSECGLNIEYRYEDYDKIYNLFAARYDFHVNCYSRPEYILGDYILNVAIQEIQPKINSVLVTEIRAKDMSEFLKLTDNYVLNLVQNSALCKFLQHDTKYQNVDELECETTHAHVKVKSVSKYMPRGDRIIFYGDIKGKHKNLQQEDAFIKFMEQHSDIARGFTKSEKGLVEKLWKDLTKELNSMGPSLHDMSGWKKVWCDWKACIKKKIATNKMEAKATGGGPYNQLYISKKEEAVGQLCGLFAIVEGIQGSNSFGTNNTSNLLLSSDEEVFLTEKNSKAGKRKSTEVDSEAPSTSKRASQKSRDDNLKDHLKQYIGSDLQNRTKILESLQNLTDISQLNTEKLDIIASNIIRVYKSIDNIADELKRHHNEMEKAAVEKNMIKRTDLEIKQRKLELEEIKNKGTPTA